MNAQKLSDLIADLTGSGTVPAVSIAVGVDGKMVYRKAFGSIYETGMAINAATPFDIASMTKIFTGIVFMQLVEQGKISLSDPICKLFPQMGGIKPIESDGRVVDYCDANKVTWRNVLTHSTGIAWTREKTRPSLPGLGEGLDVIYELPFAYQPGESMVYTDIPFILMGKAMELIESLPLDRIVEKNLLLPLGLQRSGYRRLSDPSGFVCGKHRIPPTEYDDAFRMKRIWEEVLDENAWQLDGVSAHAGIFSTAEDVCRLMMAFENWRTSETGLLSPETVKEMTRLQTELNGERRGLMWQLSSLENSYTSVLSGSAYGHSGFTGCFAWNDPERKISVVLLSNDVYNGRGSRQLFRFRKDILEKVLEQTLV